METDDVLLREYSSSGSLKDAQKARGAVSGTTNTHYHSAYSDKNISGGAQFSLNPFAFGLGISAKGEKRSGWRDQKYSASASAQSWSQNERELFTAVSEKDKTHRTTSQRFNRKLVFTVDFVNLSDEDLAIDSEKRTPTIPVFCGETHLGDALAVDPRFSIPCDGEPYPCKFELSLAESGIDELLKNIPEIRVEKAQLLICGETVRDAIRKGPYFTVRLVSETENLSWEIAASRKSPVSLLSALRAINEASPQAPFAFSEDGSLVSAVEIPFTPSKDAAGFLLAVRNGEPLTDLNVKPGRNDEIEFLLIPRETLETLQPEPLTPLIPHRETLEKWAKDGFFDGKYLASNFELTSGKRLVKTVDGIEYAFRWCPAGTLTMGSPTSESGRNDDETQHKVTLTRGFWMLETEVTQAMWESVMGENPSEFRGDQNPVEQVSWDDCQDFCGKLSSKLGVKVSLPTEAQWEYACRAGTTGAYAGSLDAMGWYNENWNTGSTHPVGQKEPNAWGFYDMHGNVWEWCLDWYVPYAESPTSDPMNSHRGSSRVFRGGGWGDDAGLCRGRNTPDYRNYDLGFRIVWQDSKE